MPTTNQDLATTLAAIQETLAALTARVAALESAGVEAAAAAEALPAEPEQAAPELATAEVTSPGRTTGESRAAEPVADGIAPDVLLVIAAAVAAFLGERAHVRQVRLISSQAWGQQGRVNVQASHVLHR